jgi:hypothetical protein
LDGDERARRHQLFQLLKLLACDVEPKHFIESILVGGYINNI